MKTTLGLILLLFATLVFLHTPRKNTTCGIISCGISDVGVSGFVEYPFLG